MPNLDICTFPLSFSTTGSLVITRSGSLPVYLWLFFQLVGSHWLIVTLLFDFVLRLASFYFLIECFTCCPAEHWNSWLLNKKVEWKDRHGEKKINKTEAFGWSSSGPSNKSTLNWWRRAKEINSSHQWGTVCCVIFFFLNTSPSSRCENSSLCCAWLVIYHHCPCLLSDVFFFSQPSPTSCFPERICDKPGNALNAPCTHSTSASRSDVTSVEA